MIIEKVGDYPTPVDPDNPTIPEQEAIDAWQTRYDNYVGLIEKADKVEWNVEDCDTIIKMNGGPTVTKAGLFGILHHFPVDRILKPDPATWYTSKVSALITNGWALKGWVITVEDGEAPYAITRAFLEAKSYSFI